MSIINLLPFVAALLSSIKFCYDSFISFNDMERADGCDWEWESYCSSLKVSVTLINI